MAWALTAEEDKCSMTVIISAGMQSFDVESGLGSLLKVSVLLSCFPHLYQMEYWHAERMIAQQTILEEAMFGILLVSPNMVFKG